jgi:hypothetical protein
VTYFILPAGGHRGASTVFYWCLEEIEPKKGEDKTKRTVIDIPYNIPTGFVLGVKANTLRDGPYNKRMARCVFGPVPMCFAMNEDALLSELKRRAIGWMSQRGQGIDWTIEGPENEAIDFDHCYEVVPTTKEESVNIFLKQRAIEVQLSESWINLSDRIVRALGLPRGTLFRIYPVIGDIQDHDPEDHSYSITWEEGKQYWFDIIYDDGRDKRGQAKEIRMIDSVGRADNLVVPVAANIQEIIELWKRLMEIPNEIEIEARSWNAKEYFWGYRTAAETIPCTLRTANMHGDTCIFPGQDQFKADQIGRILDVKVHTHPEMPNHAQRQGRYDYSI